MKCIYIILSAIIIAGCSKTTDSLTVENMRCEYLKEPLGIDIQHPRFSWELESVETGKLQTAYRVLVSADSTLLSKDQVDAWDSKKINSNHTNQITYEGAPLRPHTFYYWKIQVWDEKGRLSAWSPVTRFSTGPLSADDWTAQWIGDPEAIIAPEKIYYQDWGYRSDLSTNPEVDKWLTIDLEQEQPVDVVKLYPLQLEGSYLFPLRFTVELSTDPDFNKSTVIVDESQQDIVKRDFTPYTKSLASPLSGRYLRLNVTKIPSVKDNRFEYGLAEIEVSYKNKNIALGKPVLTSDKQIPQYWGNSRWDASLITDGYFKPNNNPPYSLPVPPSPLLRKEIEIDKKIKHAFYYTSGLGIYEAYINGQKVGRQVLAPEWTDYDSHVQYQTHEVSALLKQGTNVLGAMLADGWYAGAIWSHPERGGYGFSRYFMGQLVICFEDETSVTINTDKSWKYLPRGPVTQASIFDGELYEATYLPVGWNRSGFDDSAWKTPSVYNKTKINLCAQMNEPIAVIEKIKPVSIRKIADDKYIFDLGQNMVGWCRLHLPYNPKRPIVLRYAEILDEDSSLYIANLRAAKQTDTYIPGDEQVIEYEPRFTYHGFRYVEISGLTRKPDLNQILGKMVASSSPVTGSFSCSNKDINQLWKNIRWTQWDNMISVPTDCPQRDERAGWMGDAQVFSQTAIYNLDMAAFYTKWVRDIRDSQLDDGRFPDIAPHVGFWQAFFNSPGWADAGVIVPWKVYLNYNDTVILSKQYEAMKIFVNFVHRRNPDLIWVNSIGNMYGDWLNGNTIIADDYPQTGGAVPNDVFATAYFAYSTELLSKTAEILGKRQDHEYYCLLADSIRKTFADHFVAADGTIKGNTQAGYALALELDILPDSIRNLAAGHMVETVKNYNFRMSTGIHTTIRLMNQLSEFGFQDIAYTLLLSRRFPSWLYSIDQGATTIWERWDGYVKGRGFQNPGMNSFNHVAIGAVGEWMYQHILGIQYDELQPGYRHFYIKPQPGGNLEWAKGNYHAITGNIGVAWTDKNNLFTLDVTVAANTEATVVMPYKGQIKIETNKAFVKKSGNEIRIGSGKYVLSVSH